MPLKFTRPQVVIRPALPLDRDDVLEFTKHIWEGEDYIPYVWDEWLAAPEGFMVVAEYGGLAIGLGRLTYLAPDQWWLEGLRVNPDREDQGIGSALNDYLLHHWLGHGSGVVRLMTASFRAKVHHLCERSGFSKIGEYTFFAAQSLEEPAEAFYLVSEAEVLDALDFTRQADSLRLAYGMMGLGWHCVTPNVQSLTASVEEHTAYWWRGREGLLTFWRDEDLQGNPTLMIGMAACQVATMAGLLLDCRRLATHLGCQKASWIASLHPDLQPIFLNSMLPARLGPDYLSVRKTSSNPVNLPSDFTTLSATPLARTVNAGWPN